MAAAATGLAAAQPAAGGLSLSVAPVSLAFAPGATSTSTVVSNPGGAPITVQVRVFGWTTRGDEDVYAPSDDLGFSPAAFRLAPGQKQVVRLALLRPPQGREAAYRLFIDQLPLTSAGGGLQMPVRMVLPVFAEPAPAPARPRSSDLRWRASWDAARGMVTVTVANTGAAHARIIDLSYLQDGAAHPIRAGLSGYALAGAERSWSFPSARAPQTLTLAANADGPSIRVDVPVSR